MLKTSSWLSILMLIMLAACGSQTPTLVDTSTGGMILFASDAGGREAYYLLPAGGETQQPALLSFAGLPAGAQLNRPVWSPQIKKWLLSAAQGADSEIYSADWDGSNLTNLTNDPGRFDSDPIPSPDGRYIAFVAIQSDLDIFVMRANGADAKNLTLALGGREMNPSWMSDSNRLVFSSNYEGTPNVYLMERDGSSVNNLSKGNGLDEGYSLSPDQNALVFSSDRDGNRDLFHVDLRSQAITNLTSSPIREVEPVYSPDGAHLLFRTFDDGNHDLMVLNLADNQITNLTNSPDVVEDGHSWWPDSQKIIFTAIQNDQLDIFTVDLAGNIVNLTNSPANEYGGIWVAGP